MPTFLRYSQPLRALSLVLAAACSQAGAPTSSGPEFSNIGNTTVLKGGHKITVHYAADRMWGAALTLIALVMALNLLARIIARRSKVTT